MALHLNQLAALLFALGCLTTVQASFEANDDFNTEELFISTFKTVPAAWGSTYGLRNNRGYYYYGEGPVPNPSPRPPVDPPTSPAIPESPALSPSLSTGLSPTPSPGPDEESPAPTPAEENPAPTTEQQSPVQTKDLNAICTGIAYDGYVTACTLWSDGNGDGVQATSEAFTTITNGKFTFAQQTNVGSLGTLYLTIADESATQATKGSTSICHDVTSLLPIRFPLAAPKPPSCNNPIVVSPLTSLLAYGSQSGLTTTAMLEALSLPAGYAVLSTDTLAAAIAGDASALKVYRREVQVVQLTMTAAKLFTKNKQYMPVIRKFMLKALANQIMGPHSGRRLLSDNMASVQSVIDLTKAATIEALLKACYAIAAATVPADQLTVVSGDMLAAVANAIATLNSIIESSEDVDSIMKAAVVGETVLASKVASLVNGEISVSEFQAATSQSALKATQQQVVLPGAQDSEQQKKQSNAVALGVGLGIGLGVPLVAGAGYAAYYYFMKKPRSAGGLSESML